MASQPAFLALRLAGAAYLVYLGTRLLLAPKDKLLPAGPAMRESDAAAQPSRPRALGFGSLSLYAVVLARARGVVRRPRLARDLIRRSGGVLVRFGPPS